MILKRADTTRFHVALLSARSSTQKAAPLQLLGISITDLLQLRRAAENKYDKRTVEVYWQNNMPGYIPKVAKMSISQILDNSGKLNAEITLLYPQQKPWYCVDLVVYLDSSQGSSTVRMKKPK